MACFKNKARIEVEFLSAWPDRAEEGLSEMKEAISKWAAKHKISLDSVRKNTEVETVSE